MSVPEQDTRAHTAHTPNPSIQDDRLRERTAHLRDDLSTVKEDVAEIASVAGQRARTEAERLTELARSGTDQAQELGDSLMRTVRTHPTASILVTLGVGVVLGRIVAGR